MIDFFSEITSEQDTVWGNIFQNRIRSGKLQKWSSSPLADLTSNFTTSPKRERILSRLNLSVRYIRRARRATVDGKWRCANFIIRATSHRDRSTIFVRRVAVCLWKNPWNIRVWKNTLYITYTQLYYAAFNIDSSAFHGSHLPYVNLCSRSHRIFTFQASRKIFLGKNNGRINKN